MKRAWIIGGVVAGVVALGVILAVVLWPEGVENSSVVEKPVEKFALSEGMYDKGELVEITASEFDKLVAQKKSFVVVLHMVICPAEFPVTNSAKQLAHNEKMRIYSLTEEEFKQTELVREVKYLPSVALIREGELMDYLDAEADEDLSYYKTAEGLKEWIGKWVNK